MVDSRDAALRLSGGLERLPIRLILPKQGTERKVPGGGGGVSPFQDVDSEFRQRLSNQVSAIQDLMASQEMRRIECAPVRVRLHHKALAKTHRPDTLFSEKSCPIIGAGRLGDLFVKATPKGLQTLGQAIRTNESKPMVKELSCIETIEPIGPAFRRADIEAKDILRQSPRGEKGFLTRVRLFDFRGEEQSRLLSGFESMCRNRDVRVSIGGYSPDSYVFEVECNRVEDVDEIARAVSVRSISRMPLLRAIRPRVFNAKPLSQVLTSATGNDDVPIVVVVDSGVSDKMSGLESWVVGRQSDVSPEYRNTDHGTFVAGLICWGGHLNPNLKGVDDSPCGVFDLQVIPNGDPAHGDIDALTESEFLQSLATALQQYANKYRVWNLSLGTDQVCSLDEFSPLAEQLDNLQEKFQVSFVISAGNYDRPPLLDYPRSADQIEAGRITSPADSVLGITVGSVSHVGYRKNGPREHHPSPFSRHGSGPNHIIKPDFIHYGGTCSKDLSHQSGIRSIYGDGCAEDLGTSFAAPLVSRTLAQVYHSVTPTPSPVLARALLTHHARDPRTNRRVPDGDERYFGFGLPASVPYCLECTPHTSTLVFEDQLRSGFFLEWDDFPYPESLRRDGRYFGEIWMTVAFAAARGARWGTEYCETHVDAHFGVYRSVRSRKNGTTSSKFVGLVPPEHKNPGILYESYQVEHLRKWSPVRTYHGNMGEKGQRGDRWRLKVQLLTRHGIENGGTFGPQPFALIVTISDPERKAPVYNEMARVVLNRFRAENLVLRPAVRVRGLAS